MGCKKESSLTKDKFRFSLFDTDMKNDIKQVFFEAF